MVQLVPGTPNPTMSDIDHYIRMAAAAAGRMQQQQQRTIREIQCKSGAGALLHPSEEYFLERSASI